MPHIVREVGVAGVVPIAEPRRGPRPARIFPLRFGRQPVNAVGGDATRRPFPPRQLATVIRGVKPTHHFHRAIRVTFEVAWVVPH